MTASLASRAAREGLGRPAGEPLAAVLERVPWLPSVWGGQDALAAWVRGGPEDAGVVERAVVDGTLERVWGPGGALCVTTPERAGWIRAAYSHLATQVGADATLVERLLERWPDGDAGLTVGRAAGVLGCPRRVAGPVLQLGCLQGRWTPRGRDEEGRLRFHRVRSGTGPPWDARAARGQLVACVVVSRGRCPRDELRARLGPEVAEDGLLAALGDRHVRAEGDHLVAERATPPPAVGTSFALVGRGDPCGEAALRADGRAEASLPTTAPALVLADGQLLGTWSERWVRRTLHVDLTLPPTTELTADRRATVSDRIASLGRFRGARSARWSRLGEAR